MPQAAFRIFREAVEILEAVGIDLVVCGGIAVWAYGRQRATGDIDLLVEKEAADVALSTLRDAGFDTKRTDAGWLYQAFKDQTKIDLIFRASGDITLTPRVLEHSVQMKLGGHEFPIISPEDLLIMKAHALTEERSRDWFDALSIIRGTGGKLNWDYLANRSRSSLRRILSLLLFAQSEDEHNRFVPGWVTDKMMRALLT